MSKHKRKRNKILPKNRVPRVTSSSLEDKIKESGLFGEKEVTLVKSMGEKMSEVLFDFAEPLLDEVDDDHHAMDKAISFAAAVWNLSLMSKSDQKKGVNDILEIIRKDDPEMLSVGHGIIEMLLDRKKKYFPNNKRFIISYELGLRNGQPWLNVASTP